MTRKKKKASSVTMNTAQAVEHSMRVPAISQYELDCEVLRSMPYISVIVRDYIPGEIDYVTSDAVVVVRMGVGIARLFLNSAHVLAMLATIEQPYVIQRNSNIAKLAADAALTPASKAVSNLDKGLL